MFRLKKMGGLGFMKTEVINRVFLIKLIWRIVYEKDNMWIQVIKVKYLIKIFLLERKIKNTDLRV